MTAANCPDPTRCPVPAPPTGTKFEGFGVVVVPAGSIMCRAYQLKRGYDSFNPGHGDTRFAPIVNTVGRPVSTMYVGSDDVCVLLETVFHDVHHTVTNRLIYEAVVRTWGIAYTRLPIDVRLADLRDSALAALGLSRSQLLATTAEHYPCTREWSAALHAGRIGGEQVDGLLWYSRQAELFAPRDPHEVFVLFGDRVPSDTDSYPLAGPGVRSLIEGPGRNLLERLAEELDARIELADD